MGLPINPPDRQRKGKKYLTIQGMPEGLRIKKVGSNGAIMQMLDVADEDLRRLHDARFPTRAPAAIEEKMRQVGAEHTEISELEKGVKEQNRLLQEEVIALKAGKGPTGKSIDGLTNQEVADLFVERFPTKPERLRVLPRRQPKAKKPNKSPAAEVASGEAIPPEAGVTDAASGPSPDSRSHDEAPTTRAESAETPAAD